MGPIPGHLVLLHGHDDDPAAFATHATALAPPGWTTSAPSGPNITPAGVTWFRAGGHGEPDPFDVEVALDRLDEELDRIARRLDGDQHLVLAGFSQGAALALLHVLRPSPSSAHLRAVIAIAGWLPAVEDVDLDLHAVASRVDRVLVAHGEDDEVVPLPLGRSVGRLLERQGVPVSFVERPVGHEVDPFVEPVRAWLDAFDADGS